MAKKNKTFFFYFVLIAFFAMFSFASISKAETQTMPDPGQKGSSVHTCKKLANDDWRCMYDGEAYDFKVNDDGKQKAGFLGSCKPLAQRLDELNGCLFCPLFLVLFNSVQDMASKSFEAIALYAKVALVVGFAIWIALKTLPLVSSITKQEGVKYIKELLVQTFKVGICFFLLENPTQIYHWVIDTILIAAMDFSNSFLFNVDTSSITPTFGQHEFNQGNIGLNVITALDRLLQAMQKEIGFLMAMGSSTLCVGIKSLRIGMFLNGVIVYFLTIILLISFGFYLADAVIQLGIVGALMPFLIATYPFKITEKFAKKGFEILMNTFFTFLILGVVISIDIELILQSMVSNSAVDGGGSKAALFAAFSENDHDAINSLFDIGAAGGLGLIACIMLAFKFTEQATTIADKYSGGGLVKDTSNKIGTLAASGVTNVARKVAKPATKAVGKKLKKVGGKIASAANKKASKIISNSQKGLADAAAKTKESFDNSKFGKSVNSTIDKGAQKLNDIKTGASERVNKIGQQINDSEIGKATQAGAEKLKNSKVGKVAIRAGKAIASADYSASGIAAGVIVGGRATGSLMAKGLNNAANATGISSAKEKVRGFMGLDTKKSKQEAIDRKITGGENE